MMDRKLTTDELIQVSDTILDMIATAFGSRAESSAKIAGTTSPLCLEYKRDRSRRVWRKYSKGR